MKYRAEIDGLRAVAVTPVVLFHAGAPWVTGGFLGVDVFFVISGYLITTIIKTDLEEGRFSLARFYERRARRILPALFLVLACCLPFAWMWMLPAEFKDFSVSLVATLAFLSNILFWRQTGYFDAAAELKPLQHTWSLSVEEQFYVFFPLTMLVLMKAGRRWIVPFLFVAALVSLGLAEYASRTHPEFNFFVTITRAWELLAGSLCAFAAPRVASRWGGGLAAAGLLGVVASLFVFGPETPLPSLLGLLPVGGACLVLLYGVKGTRVARLLSTPVIVFIGLISYSLYLWHQPIFVFARLRSLSPLDPASMAALIGLSVLLAYLSWRFVERPFRFEFRAPGEPRALLGAAIGMAAALAAFGVIGRATSGLPSRLPAEALALNDASNDRNMDWTRCKRLAGPERCVYGAEEPRVALFGDSHGRALSDALGGALADQGLSMADFSNFGCLPSRGFEAVFFTRRMNACGSSRQSADFIAADPSIRTVVITARWAYWTETRRYVNDSHVREAGDEAHHIRLNGQIVAVPGEAASQLIAADAVATIRSLLAAGKRVILIYPVPEQGWDVPTYLARAALFGAPVDRPLAVI